MTALAVHPLVPSLDGTTVDICVCTFRRAHLTQTLAAIAALKVPAGVGVRLLVVDNDIEPSARARVAAFTPTAPFPVIYLHCPAGNISVARNGALDAATARWVAFLDDDETPTPGWLSALLAAAHSTGADVILGPVRADYAPGAPDWMRQSAAHSTTPAFVGGRITTGYTCNVMFLREAPALAGLRFDPALGRSGGEDTRFFATAHDRGARIEYSEAALVTEIVPPGRATFGWLARRSFRAGQTHGRMSGDGKGPLRRLGGASLAAFKVLYCLGNAALHAFRPASRNVAALRGCLHAGAVSGYLGAREILQYGLPPSAGGGAGTREGTGTGAGAGTGTGSGGAGNG